VDTRTIPEDIPCITLANSTRAWTMPSYNNRRDYSSVTVNRLFKARAQDNRCHELRQELDRNAHSRYYENAQGLLVRREPLYRATQVYVPKYRHDYCVLLSPYTHLTDNGPQLTSTLFQGVCRLMKATKLYSTTYHPRTKGQVERYKRTIVGQPKAYVEDRQYTWVELVSVLTLAYISRPRKSTGVAPLEFVVPEGVRTLALGRLPKDPYPERVPRTAREAREKQRGHLRSLITQVRAGLSTVQRTYKRKFVKRVRPVNKALKIGD